MALLDPFRNVWQSLLSSFQSQYYLLVVGALGVFVAAIIAYGSGLGAALWNSPWFWLVVIVLAALGLWGGIRYGIPWLRERDFLRRSSSPYLAAGQESPQEFQAKFLKALHTLQGLPQLKGKEDPRYVLPWYLLIGGERSGKTLAVRGAEVFSPLLTPFSDEATQNCDWWISNTAVILDTAGRYVTQADKARDRGEWYRLLRLLYHYREHEPINGLIIAVPTDALVLQSEEQLRTEASQLRERIEEVVRELGSDFPVYLLITKCDCLEGFREFFSQFPARVQTEVFGFVDDPLSALGQTSDPSARGETALQQLGAGLQGLVDRLHRFRLTLLDSRQPAQLRQSTFCFPEEFTAVCRSLLSFATPLFHIDTRYHTPLLRGVFFTSVRQHGARLSPLRRQLHLSDPSPVAEEGNVHYFLYDLFQSILPRDRGLVNRTEREHRKKGLSRFLRVGGRVGAVVLVSAWLLNAFLVDQPPPAFDPRQCPEPTTQTPTRPLLDEVDRCRQTLQTLIEHNDQRSRWSTFLFNSTGQLEGEFKQRYMRIFQTHVLAPLNNATERILPASENPVPLILLIARRIRLTKDCLAATGCFQSPLEDVTLDYPLMLAPQGDQNPTPQDLARLKAAYQAYLLWQPSSKAPLEQDLNDDYERLRKFTTKQLTFDRLRDSVNRRSPPVTYEHYWDLPTPLNTVAPPQLEAACTQRGWEQELVTPLEPIQYAVPDLAAQFRTFQEQHIVACLEQWRKFLTEFPQGADRWKKAGKQKALAILILTEQSPYRRVLTDAWQNLAPWVSTPRETDSAQWVTLLKNFSSSPQQQTYYDELKQVALRLEKNTFPQAALALVRDIFTENKPPDESTHPLLRAWAIASQLTQAREAQAGSESNVLQPLLQEPVRYVWRTLSEEASLAMQKSWDDQLRPLAGLPAIEQLVGLHGPGGEVERLIKQELEPLLRGTGPSGEKFFLPAEIARAVDMQEQLGPLFKGTISPIEVRAGRQSSIEGDSPLLEDRTILSMSCAGKSYRVTTRPRDEAETVATIQWSYQGCTEVSLNIYFSVIDGGKRRQSSGQSPAPPPKQLQLTKRYFGATGFLQFFQDFLTGVHRFQMDDFEPNPQITALLQDSVNYITVYYSLTIRPPLDKFIAALQKLSALHPYSSTGLTRQPRE
jgi:type VI secretion system protein ImpL